MLNLPISHKNDVMVMSSVDLAELCVGKGKDDHSNFMKKAKKVLGDTVVNFYEREKYNGGKNEREILLLPEREACLMAMSYSYELQARVYDAWQELKSSKPSVPQTYAAALLEAGRIALELEESEKQLAIAAPKAEVFDKIVERNALMNATQVGSKIGLSAYSLNKLLDKYGVYNKAVKRNKRTFKLWFIDGGYGEMKVSQDGYSQALFTNAGEMWVVETLTSEGII